MHLSRRGLQGIVMKPIGPLMREHRLIERCIPVLTSQVRRIRKEKTIDLFIIGTVVDFFRTYADRTHHGKEEEILFRSLATKALSPEHARVTAELMDEHRYARSVTRDLVAAKERYLQGDAASLAGVLSSLETLAGFYPKHIEKEDRHFFFPILDYFTRQEQDAMLDEFSAFDRKMIHEKYAKVIESLEGLP